MDASLYEMIFKRRSFHLFRNAGDAKISEAELAGIPDAWSGFSPLHPEIRTGIRIVPGEEKTCRRGQEYSILLYSENKEGYLQNIGYLGEQLDLYLVSQNIGTLWFGIGKTEETSYDGMDFVIMIAIRKVQDSSLFRRDMFKSKRKTADEIWQGETLEGVTDIVRFAPSACNTQPWYVENDRKSLRVFRYKKPGKRGIVPAEKISYYNCIDIGIFLCFLELCLQHREIRFQRQTLVEENSNEEKKLNAIYIICR